jgi:putative hemolysin
MINRVLDLQNRTVGQITTALGRAVTVTTRTPMSEVLQLSREKSFTRMPVWQADADRPRIVGIVSLKTLLYLTDLDVKKTAADYVKPALFLDETMRLEEALRRMQRSGQRLAIVLGRDRQEVGIVSLPDILKIIFGEVSL